MVTARPERIWNDPPMPGEPRVMITPETANAKLGEKVPIEIKQLFVALDGYHRRVHLISTTVLALSFTIMLWVVITVYPEITPTDILMFSGLATVATAVSETLRYFKVY